MDQQSQSFELQLKASPMMHDILDRLVRSEYTTREIQRDLGDINRKVNLLVERALGVNNSQLEFKDPFDANSTSSNLIRHRPSIGNIAPNQAANTDDISSISQRLNTLTSSVGQLLALQTQQLQHQQTSISDGRSNSVISLNPPQLDLAPNQIMPPSGVGNVPMLGHGLPNRPDLRARHPNPPLRTWSAGTLDLPMRPPEQGIGRQEAILRDKRRSVSGLLRRDSSGVSYIRKISPASIHCSCRCLTLKEIIGLEEILVRMDQ
jgi:translation initiation factor 4A